MTKKILKVYVLKKTHTINGNPNYKIFIPDVSGKVEGLRKLKTPHTYSIQSFNLKKNLQTFVFKNKTVRLIRD